MNNIANQQTMDDLVNKHYAALHKVWLRALSGSANSRFHTQACQDFNKYLSVIWENPASKSAMGVADVLCSIEQGHGVGKFMGQSLARVYASVGWSAKNALRDILRSQQAQNEADDVIGQYDGEEIRASETVRAPATPLLERSDILRSVANLKNKIARQTNNRKKKEYAATVMFLDGYSQTDIAQLLGCYSSTIQRWLEPRGKELVDLGHEYALFGAQGESLTVFRHAISLLDKQLQQENWLQLDAKNAA